MFISALLTLICAGFTTAQNQVIQVGGTTNTPNGGIFQFIPPNITATVGSVITFNFSGIPGFHSVSQSSFQSPCQPLTGGFDSGFVEVGVSQTPAAIPQWNLTITNASAPIWFFCKQLAPQFHCPAGMVGSINAPSTGNTFGQFQAAARASSGQPGQAEGGLVGLGASASAPPSPLNTVGVSGLNNPTQAAAPSQASSATTSGSAASPSTTTSDAVSTAANGFFVLVAALVGFAIA